MANKIPKTIAECGMIVEVFALNLTLQGMISKINKKSLEIDIYDAFGEKRLTYFDGLAYISTPVRFLRTLKFTWYCNSVEFVQYKAEREVDGNIVNYFVDIPIRKES